VHNSRSYDFGKCQSSYELGQRSLAVIPGPSFQDSHITLVCVHTVKQGLRRHPLDWQAALEGRVRGIRTEFHRSLCWLPSPP
jgi:hypothetical protein